ncbi:MAG: ATP-binding protein [Lachnospira sp.]
MNYNELEENSVRLNKKTSVIDWIFFFGVIIIFALFFIGQNVFEHDAVDISGKCEIYSGNWIVTRQDGSTQEITMPGTCEADRNELITLEGRLPVNIEEKTFFCMVSVKQELKIYVGGELREIYSTKDTRKWGAASPSQYVFVELYPEDSGKTMTIESKTDSSYSGVFYSAYYGDIYAIWQQLYSEKIPEVFVGIIAIIMALVSILVGIFIRIHYKKETEIYYLGMIALFGATWLLCNSALRQFIFNNVSLANDMAFIMIMMMSLMFSMYIDVVQNKRYTKYYSTIEVIQLISMFVCVALHVTGRKDFGDTFAFMVVMVALNLLLFIITTVQDIIIGEARNYSIILFGLGGVAVCVTVQILLYLNRQVEFNGLLIMIGLLIILLISIIKSIFDLWKYQIERQKIIMAGNAKGKFLANMSHEIRTPINSVMGLNEMILRESKDNNIREYAVKIKNASQSLLDIVNDVLDFSKIDSGKMELVPVSYELRALLDSLCSMVNFRAKNKGLRVECHFAPDLPKMLYGDDVRIKQIITNLLSNAVKYTDKGYISFTVSGNKIYDQYKLHVSVNDTGIGIKPEDMNKIFGEFSRIDLSRNRTVEGTGLGLSIARRLLELMGSELKVKSIYGVGSEFSFDVIQDIADSSPMGDVENYAKEEAAGYEYETRFVAPDAHILVVDDNEMNLFVFENLVKETKVHVTTATSGKQCLELLKNNEYDVIFLDHMMPEMDGIETFHRIKEDSDNNNAGKPIIALTANAIGGAREMYMKEGFTDYITKPIVYEQLELLLNRYIPDEKCLTEKLEINTGSMPDSSPDTYMNSGTDAVSNDNTGQDTNVSMDIEGIDWTFARTHFKDDDSIIEILKGMSKTLEKDADNIMSLRDKLSQNPSDKDSLNLMRIAAHTMKSQGAMVGNIEMSGLARTVEKAAKNEDITNVLNVSTCLIKEMRDFKSRLQILCAGEETKNNTVNSFSEIRETVDMLVKASEGLELEVMDSCMEELNRNNYPPEMASFIEELGLAVTDLDADRVKAAVDGLMKMYN